MNFLKVFDKPMSPIQYIIQEIEETLDHLKESTLNFNNSYTVGFNKEISTFVIGIRGKLDKSLKQGVHSKFNKLMIYKGIVFSYIFVYDEEVKK